MNTRQLRMSMPLDSITFHAMLVWMLGEQAGFLRLELPDGE